MQKAEEYARAIRAVLAYTGKTQAELAQRMGIHEDTLRRKLRRPEDFKVGELIAADKAVRWTHFLQKEKE